MRFVKDDPSPGYISQSIRMGFEKIVIDDHPARIFNELAATPYDFDSRCWINKKDFPFPVELQRSRTHNKKDPVITCDIKRDNRLPGFAETHIVCKNGSLLVQEKSDTVGLMRIKTAGLDF